MYSSRSDDVRGLQHDGTREKGSCTCQERTGRERGGGQKGGRRQGGAHRVRERAEKPEVHENRTGTHECQLQVAQQQSKTIARCLVCLESWALRTRGRRRECQGRACGACGSPIARREARRSTCTRAARRRRGGRRTACARGAAAALNIIGCTRLAGFAREARGGRVCSRGSRSLLTAELEAEGAL